MICDVILLSDIYGSTYEEQAVIDSIVDVCTEYREGVVQAFLKSDDEERV